MTTPAHALFRDRSANTRTYRVYRDEGSDLRYEGKVWQTQVGAWYSQTRAGAAGPFSTRATAVKAVLHC